MPVYPRGGAYMVSVGSKADRYRATFPTREEAEKAELEEKLRRKNGEIRRPEEKRPSTSKTLEDAFDLTFRLEWKGSKSEATMEKNGRAVLKAFGKYTPIDEIDEEDIDEAIIDWEDGGNSGSTVNRKLSVLSKVLKTAKDRGWIKKSPKIQRRKEGKHRIRWMDEQEEARVLAVCNHLGLYDLHDFIVFSVDTGFRRMESLRFSPKDFRNNILHLHEGETKNDDARAIPATTRVAAIVNARAKRKTVFDGLTPDRLRYQWGQLKTAMGLDDDKQFLVHMLRHTCASRMVQRGVPLIIVKEWMGHKNIQTTMRYAHLAPDSLSQGLAALEGGPQGITGVVSSVPSEVVTKVAA